MAAVRPRKPTNDAEAIVIAARQPEMRFVAPKTAEQQAKAVMFRSRERLVHQRTELVNALRAVLYEYGHVFPTSPVHLKRVEALEDQACDLPALIIAECRDFLAQIAEKTERIDAKTKELKALAAETDTARRLQTMPGVGPLTALAVEAFAPDMAQFKCGRDLFARETVPPDSFLTPLTLAGALASAAFLRRQGAAWAYLESRPEGYSTAFDHRGDDTDHGPHPSKASGGELARAAAGQEAEDVGRDCACEPDGAATLGDADEERGLQRSGAGGCDMNVMSSSPSVGTKGSVRRRRPEWAQRSNRSGLGKPENFHEH